MGKYLYSMQSTLAHFEAFVLPVVGNVGRQLWDRHARVHCVRVWSTARHREQKTLCPEERCPSMVDARRLGFITFHGIVGSVASCCLKALS